MGVTYQQDEIFLRSVRFTAAERFREGHVVNYDMAASAAQISNPRGTPTDPRNYWVVTPNGGNIQDVAGVIARSYGQYADIGPREVDVVRPIGLLRGVDVHVREDVAIGQYLGVVPGGKSLSTTYVGRPLARATETVTGVNVTTGRTVETEFGLVSETLASNGAVVQGIGSWTADELATTWTLDGTGTAVEALQADGSVLLTTSAAAGPDGSFETVTAASIVAPVFGFGGSVTMTADVASSTSFMGLNDAVADPDIVDVHFGVQIVAGVPSASIGGASATVVTVAMTLVSTGLAPATLLEGDTIECWGSYYGTEAGPTVYGRITRAADGSEEDIVADLSAATITATTLPVPGDSLGLTVGLVNGAAAAETLIVNNFSGLVG